MAFLDLGEGVFVDTNHVSVVQPALGLNRSGELKPRTAVILQSGVQITIEGEAAAIAARVGDLKSKRG